MEQVSIESVDRAGTRVAEAGCVAGDGIENRLNVGRRSADDS
jgi:hypothetical protein